MRIVGGRWGGRRLVAPKTDATRPTADRVREALFSVLGRLDGVAALDLYAGSGALGLEALSRGARRAVLVDDAKAALEAIRANVTALGADGSVKIVARSVERAASSIAPEAPFELVFADPPYELLRDGRALRALDATVTLVTKKDALVVVEHAARDAVPVLSNAAPEETRRYGDTAVTFYRRA